MGQNKCLCNTMQYFPNTCITEFKEILFPCETQKTSAILLEKKKLFFKLMFKEVTGVV